MPPATSGTSVASGRKGCRSQSLTPTRKPGCLLWPLCTRHGPGLGTRGAEGAVTSWGAHVLWLPEPQMPEQPDWFLLLRGVPWGPPHGAGPEPRCDPPRPGTRHVPISGSTGGSVSPPMAGHTLPSQAPHQGLTNWGLGPEEVTPWRRMGPSTVALPLATQKWVAAAAGTSEHFAE